MTKSFKRSAIGGMLLCTSMSLIGCRDSGKPEFVMGQLVGGANAPVESAIFTEPAPGLGVKITSSAGGGRRPVVLPGSEAARLIKILELELRRWGRGQRKASSGETLFMGYTGRAEPLVISRVSGSGSRATVLLVSVGYADLAAGVALDRKNTERWLRQLRAAARY